ncbi:MAG: recombinase family protein [Pseudonocardiales bacterium]
MTVREAEAEAIRECVRRVLAGEGVRTLARDLNSRGIRTSTGGEWSAQTLKRMLASGRISGQRDHQPHAHGEAKRHLVGEIVGDAVWPAIISKEDTARVRALLMNPERRLTPATPRRCLLTGILRCGICGEVGVGAPLCGRPRDDGRMRYVCNKMPGNNRCGKIYILADPTDEHVRRMMKIALASPKFVEALRAKGQDQQGEAVLRQMTTDQRKLEELAEDYATDVITRSEWLRARGVLESRLETARKRLSTTSRTAVLEGLTGDSVAFDEVWKGLPLSRKRAVISTVLDRVIVHPAVRGRNTFDPHRLEPIWRA